jgi:hypothetical protein
MPRLLFGRFVAVIVLLLLSALVAPGAAAPPPGLTLKLNGTALTIEWEPAPECGAGAPTYTVSNGQGWSASTFRRNVTPPPSSRPIWLEPAPWTFTFRCSTNKTYSAVVDGWNVASTCHRSNQFLHVIRPKPNSNVPVNPLLWNCKPCPSHSVCFGDTTFEDIRACKGFWQASWITAENYNNDDHKTSLFHKCKYEDDCEGLACNGSYKNVVDGGGGGGGDGIRRS